MFKFWVVWNAGKEALLPKHHHIKETFICDQADVTTFSFFPCNNIPLIKLNSALLLQHYCWPQTFHRSKGRKLNHCKSKE